MMKLFKKKDKNIEAEEILAKNAESAKTAADGKNAGAAQETKEDVPETIVCPKCGKTVLKSVVKQHKYVCYECNYYFRVRAKNRIRMVSDKEAFEPWFTELSTGNPLNFPEYEEKIAKTQEKTGLSEGIVIGKTKIYGEETVLGVIDSRFMMGSMGHVVGEKITSAFERATEERLPVILFCCSGGARMQEGTVSLMQMAKTSAALKRHHNAGQGQRDQRDQGQRGIDGEQIQENHNRSCEIGHKFRQVVGQKQFQLLDVLIENGLDRACAPLVQGSKRHFGKMLRYHAPHSKQCPIGSLVRQHTRSTQQHQPSHGTRRDQ